MLIEWRAKLAITAIQINTDSELWSYYYFT